MGLEDNKDLSASSNERANRSINKAYNRHFTIDSCQRTETLSETWYELLGIHPLESLVDGEGVEGVEGVAAPVVPMELSSLEDPWSKLLHEQGVEMVDLQHSELATVHVTLSEVEVEQALQIMQEQTIEERGQG